MHIAVRDDGKIGKKKINITGDGDTKIKVNGSEHSLPFSAEYDKGTFLEVEVSQIPFAKELSDISSIKANGNTLYISPVQDMSLNVNLKDEKYRKGYDICFDFDDSLENWQDINVILKHEPGYMRYVSRDYGNGNYDPRSWYRFTDDNSITSRRY